MERANLSLAQKFFGCSGTVIGGAVAILGLGYVSGCTTTQLPTEIGIKTNRNSGDLRISTDAGLKCLIMCWPGTKWQFLSTGEHPIHIVASLPGHIPEQRNNDGSAYGVVKTAEGLPLQGNVQIWVQIQDAKDHPQDLERLYRKFPSLPNEDREDYLNRLLTRLAQHSFDSVQHIYHDVPVDQFGTSGPNIARQIKDRVEANFAAQGFGVIKVGSVVLSGINLGPAAETANQQIGLAEVSRKVAHTQQEAANDLRNAQNSLAPLTTELAHNFGQAGVAPDAIPSAMCMYLKRTDETFAQRHPQSCFPSMAAK